MDWREVLTVVTAGGDLTAAQAEAAMASILAGEAAPSQIAALAVGMRMKRITAEEVTGLVRAMVAVAQPVPLADPEHTVDTCGTGGNAIRRASTFSVSTIASFVAAGAGAKVCKHGNRAASATCGSADTLEALGVRIELDGDAVARCVEEAGMGFVFARTFHAAMRHAAPVRAELGIPTVFNYLGPLSNPARPKRQVVGVSDPTMAQPLIGTLAATGTKRAMVVHAHDGLDELTTTGPTHVVELNEGAVTSYDVDPAALGFAPATLDDLTCGDAAANAAMARAILGGEAGPHRDIVVLNAAAVLQVSGLVDDLPSGVDAAAQAISDGKAMDVLQKLIEVSNS